MRSPLLIALTTLLVSCASLPPGVDLLPASAAETVTAAKAGSPTAMESIGQAFHYGQEGVKRDMATAFRWYEAAAKAGLPSAQDYVGMFYAGGLGGVREDCGQSIAWFLRAAEGGNVESKNNAAWMLATCPDAKHRDGQKAVRLAQETISALGPDAGYISTLAAAYAETGDFARAMELQEESIWRMQREGASESRVREAQVRMQFFKERKPWRGASYVDSEAYRPQ